MRSRNRNTISSSEVHQWALSWLINSMQLKDRGPKCTATVVWNIVLRHRANDLGVRGLSGFGERSVGHQRDGHVGGGTAQDASGSGEAVECCADGSSAAAPPASRLDSGDRLALGALLRGAEAQPQRDLLRQAATGNHKIPCLRHRLHCLPRSALHFGRHLGAATRNDGHGVESPAGDNRAKELKIRRFLLDRAFFNVTVTRFLQEQQIPFVMPVMFRGRIPRAAETPGPALDPTSERRMLLAHVEEQEAVGDSLGLCGLPDSQEPQRRQTQATKAPVCRLASQRFPTGDPRTVSDTLRYRDELPPSPPGASTPAPAIPICGCYSSWSRFCCGMSGCGFTKPCWLKGTEIR